MDDEIILTQSLTSDDFESFNDYPEELYEWDDFMEYFPTMAGNYNMNPLLWKIYAYQERARTEVN